MDWRKFLIGTASKASIVFPAEGSFEITTYRGPKKGPSSEFLGERFDLSTVFSSHFIEGNHLVIPKSKYVRRSFQDQLRNLAKQYCAGKFDAEKPVPLTETLFLLPIDKERFGSIIERIETSQRMKVRGTIEADGSLFGIERTNPKMIHGKNYVHNLMFWNKTTEGDHDFTDFQINRVERERFNRTSYSFVVMRRWDRGEYACGRHKFYPGSELVKVYGR
jgi:hypothetical protein